MAAAASHDIRSQVETRSWAVFAQGDQGGLVVWKNLAQFKKFCSHMGPCLLQPWGVEHQRGGNQRETPFCRGQTNTAPEEGLLGTDDCNEVFNSAETSPNHHQTNNQAPGWWHWGLAPEPGPPARPLSTHQWLAGGFPPCKTPSSDMLCKRPYSQKTERGGGGRNGTKFYRGASNTLYFPQGAGPCGRMRPP